MRSSSLVVLLVLLVAAPAGAQAEEKANFAFHLVAENGALTCKPETHHQVVPGREVLVRVDLGGQSDWEAELRDSNGEKIAAKSQDDLLIIDSSDAAKAGSLVVAFVKDGKSDIPCGDPRSLGLTTTDAATATDVEAARWYASPSGQGEVNSLRERGPDIGRFLVHLPSGRGTFPFPSGITEGETVQVVMIVRVDDSRVIDLDIASCEAVNHFRTVTEGDGKQADRTGAAPKPPDHAAEFTLAPVGRYFRCGAGDVTYTLRAADESRPPAGTETAAASMTTSLRFRPKFHLGAVALVGWDAAQKVSFDARTATGEAMPTVVRHRDRVGAAVYVGAMWMVGGVDYEAMKARNHLLNLFVAVDPTSPLTDFAAGLALTPTGGISLGLGMTFHKGTRLDGPKVGDVFAGEGDVPTRSTWTAGRFGFIIGLTIDSKVYDALVAQAKN